ncbi:MAG: terminase [Dongiaceae bacterium]
MRLSEILARMTPEERAALEIQAAADAAVTVWEPLTNTENILQPSPQRLAYESAADYTLYGGQAGGGKTDLLVGLALTAHKRSLIMRREIKQVAAIVDRITTIIGTRDGYNGGTHRWALPADRILDLGGCKDPGDEQAYQGQPHDFIGFDELAQFLEFQFRFIVAWNRSTDPNQRCRVVGASNPPTTAEGEWIMRFWAPWLEEGYSNPAMPGELRYFLMMEDGDREVEGPDAVMVNGELLTPRSRTFIPSSVDDNPFLRTTYKATLQSLPEPLRSQMLRGDFLAGREDDPWQLIPTSWVKAAQERWQTTPRPSSRVDSLGVDPARGGRDDTVIAKRHGDWFDNLIVTPGGETPDGPTVAALVISHMKEGSAAHVDLIGIGSSVYDHLKGNRVNVIGINGSEASVQNDKSGKLGFANMRSQLWWRMREALEPDVVHPLCLPPDPRLLADLCAPRWKLTARGIQVESKPDIIKRLGRSPDRGDAVVYALVETPRKPRIPLHLLPTRANSSYSVHHWRR